MSSYMNYLHLKAECKICKTNMLSECVLRPHGDTADGVPRFRAIATAWLLCKCGFTFNKKLHGVRLKGSE